MKKLFLMVLLAIVCGGVELFAQNATNLFVPGTTVIFADDLSNAEVGVTPANWTSTTEGCKVAELNGERVIKIEGERTTIMPNVEGGLPDSFTVEYEVWSDTECPSVPFHNLNTEFTDANNDIALMLVALNPCVGFDHNELNYEFRKPTGVQGASAIDGSKVNGAMRANSWTKVQVAYSNGQCTYYINGNRMIKPTATMKPKNVRITGIDQEEVPFFIRKFRLAK